MRSPSLGTSTQEFLEDGRIPFSEMLLRGLSVSDSVSLASAGSTRSSWLLYCIRRGPQRLGSALLCPACESVSATGNHWHHAWKGRTPGTAGALGSSRDEEACIPLALHSLLMRHCARSPGICPHSLAHPSPLIRPASISM